MDSPPSAAPPVGRAQILKAAAALGVLGDGNHSATRIMAALCNSEVNARDVAALIGQEPGLYARVLRVANSPYYGQTRCIGTLDRALVVLGLNAVRGIAAAACLDRTVPRARTGALVDMTSLVHHSIATAAAAESLAQVRHPELAAEAFIAGLLHNLGVVVQIFLDARGIQAIIALRAADDRREIRALESERTLVGHEECIAVIFEEWQLPKSLIVAARNHHEPMRADEAYRPLASLINLGATLGLASGNTFTLEPAPCTRSPAAMSCLGLDDGNLDAVAADLPGRVAELKKALLDS